MVRKLNKKLKIIAIVTGVIIAPVLLSPFPRFRAPFSTVIEARDGSLLGAHIADDGQWRFPGFKQVPDKFEKSLLTFEDHWFYYHPGIKIYHWVSEERTRPSWFYRRYYWGGITDYFMAQSLPGRSEAAQSDSSPNSAIAGKERWTRLLSNLAYSTGLFKSTEKTIHSRIYLSYVMGYLAAIYRWKFPKNSQ